MAYLFGSLTPSLRRHPKRPSADFMEVFITCPPSKKAASRANRWGNGFGKTSPHDPKNNSKSPLTPFQGGGGIFFLSRRRRGAKLVPEHHGKELSLRVFASLRETFFLTLIHAEKTANLFYSKSGIFYSYSFLSKMYSSTR